MKEIRIVVTCGNNFSDEKFFENRVSSIAASCIIRYNIDKVAIIHGFSNPIHDMAERLADLYEYEFTEVTFPDDWENDVNIRNKNMAEYASEDESIGVLIAFWDGKSEDDAKQMIDLGLKHLQEINVFKY